MLVNADGTDAHIIPRTDDGFYPVFSPDGEKLAFLGFRRSGRSAVASAARSAEFTFRQVTRTAIFTVSVDGSDRQRLTPWRSGAVDIPSAYSPDGSLLGISRTSRKGGSTAIAFRVDGSGFSVLAKNAAYPVFSPDGSRIAFVRDTHRSASKRKPRTDGTELYVANADGSNLIRLTDAPTKPKYWPSWDPSGKRIAYTQVRARNLIDVLLGTGDTIREINADGTCPIQVLAAPRIGFYGASWQPGLGREAGSISC